MDKTSFFQFVDQDLIDLSDERSMNYILKNFDPIKLYVKQPIILKNIDPPPRPNDTCKILAKDNKIFVADDNILMTYCTLINEILKENTLNYTTKNIITFKAPNIGFVIKGYETFQFKIILNYKSKIFCFTCSGNTDTEHLMEQALYFISNENSFQEGYIINYLKIKYTSDILYIKIQKDLKLVNSKCKQNYPVISFAYFLNCLRYGTDIYLTLVQLNLLDLINPPAIEVSYDQNNINNNGYQDLFVLDNIQEPIVSHESHIRNNISYLYSLGLINLYQDYIFLKRWPVTSFAQLSHNNNNNIPPHFNKSSDDDSLTVLAETFNKACSQLIQESIDGLGGIILYKRARALVQLVKAFLILSVKDYHTVVSSEPGFVELNEITEQVNRLLSLCKPSHVGDYSTEIRNLVDGLRKATLVTVKMCTPDINNFTSLRSVERLLSSKGNSERDDPAGIAKSSDHHRYNMVAHKSTTALKADDFKPLIEIENDNNNDESSYCNNNVVNCCPVDKESFKEPPQPYKTSGIIHEGNQQLIIDSTNNFSITIKSLHNFGYIDMAASSTKCYLQISLCHGLKLIETKCIPLNTVGHYRYLACFSNLSNCPRLLDKDVGGGGEWNCRNEDSDDGKSIAADIHQQRGSTTAANYGTLLYPFVDNFRNISSSALKPYKFIFSPSDNSSHRLNFETPLALLPREAYLFFALIFSCSDPPPVLSSNSTLAADTHSATSLLLKQKPDPFLYNLLSSSTTNTTHNRNFGGVTGINPPEESNLAPFFDANAFLRATTNSTEFTPFYYVDAYFPIFSEEKQQLKNVGGQFNGRMLTGPRLVIFSYSDNSSVGCGCLVCQSSFSYTTTPMYEDSFYHVTGHPVAVSPCETAVEQPLLIVTNNAGRKSAQNPPLQAQQQQLATIAARQKTPRCCKPILLQFDVLLNDENEEHSLYYPNIVVDEEDESFEGFRNIISSSNITTTTTTQLQQTRSYIKPNTRGDFGGGLKVAPVAHFIKDPVVRAEICRAITKLREYLPLNGDEMVAVWDKRYSIARMLNDPNVTVPLVVSSNHSWAWSNIPNLRKFLLEQTLGDEIDPNHESADCGYDGKKLSKHLLHSPPTWDIHTFLYLLSPEFPNSDIRAFATRGIASLPCADDVLREYVPQIVLILLRFECPAQYKALPSEGILKFLASPLLKLVLDAATSNNLTLTLNLLWALNFWHGPPPPLQTSLEIEKDESVFSFPSSYSRIRSIVQTASSVWCQLDNSTSCNSIEDPNILESLYHELNTTDESPNTRLNSGFPGISNSPAVKQLSPSYPSIINLLACLLRDLIICKFKSIITLDHHHNTNSSGENGEPIRHNSSNNNTSRPVNNNNNNNNTNDCIPPNLYGGRGIEDFFDSFDFTRVFLNQTLPAICQALKRIRGDDRQRETFLRAKLLQVNKQFFGTTHRCRILIPIFPTYSLVKIDVNRSTYFKSKTLPLKITFFTSTSDSASSADQSAGEHMADIGLVPSPTLLYKVGDDVRQDQACLQIIRVMDRLWLAHGLDLSIVTFDCLPLAHDRGLVQFVDDCETLRVIQHGGGGGTFSGAGGTGASHVAGTGTAAFFTNTFNRSRCIYDWLLRYNSQELDFERAVDSFTRSCAGYCVATYVLGICDRHNDNILVKRTGQMFHIDFGKIFGDAQMFGNLKRDRVPFVFTSDMAYVINQGDTLKPNFQRFIDLCAEAFNVVRHNSFKILTMVKLMEYAEISGIPINSIDFVRKNLALELSDIEATSLFTKMIKESLSSKFTQFNFFIHGLMTHKDGGSSNLIPAAKAVMSNNTSINSTGTFQRNQHMTKSIRTGTGSKNKLQPSTSMQQMINEFGKSSVDDSLIPTTLSVASKKASSSYENIHCLTHESGSAVVLFNDDGNKEFKGVNEEGEDILTRRPHHHPTSLLDNNNYKFSFTNNIYTTRDIGNDFLKRVHVLRVEKIYDATKLYVYLCQVEYEKSRIPVNVYRTYHEFCELRTALNKRFPLALFSSLPNLRFILAHANTTTPPSINSTSIAQGLLMNPSIRYPPAVKQPQLQHTLTSKFALYERGRWYVDKFLSILNDTAAEVRSCSLVTTFFYPIVRDQRERRPPPPNIISTTIPEGDPLTTNMRDGFTPAASFQTPAIECNDIEGRGGGSKKTININMKIDLNCLTEERMSRKRRAGVASTTKSKSHTNPANVINIDTSFSNDTESLIQLSPPTRPLKSSNRILTKLPTPVASLTTTNSIRHDMSRLLRDGFYALGSLTNNGQLNNNNPQIKLSINLMLLLPTPSSIGAPAAADSSINYNECALAHDSQLRSTFRDLASTAEVSSDFSTLNPAHFNERFTLQILVHHCRNLDFFLSNNTNTGGSTNPFPSSIALTNAAEIPSGVNLLPDSYVKITLQPDPSNLTKRKTQVVFKTAHPSFNEMFTYDGLTLGQVMAKSLRVYVVNFERFRENVIMGRLEIPLNDIVPDRTYTSWYTLTK